MNLHPRSLALYFLAIVTCFHSCTCSHQVKVFEPVRSDEFQKDNSATVRYKANEILIMYKGKPTDAKRDSIRSDLQAAGINPDSVTIKTCNSCNAYVELWQGDNIHTVIHTEGIRAGTVSGGSKGVGEDPLARYSLNYIQHIPAEPLPTLRQYKFQQQPGPVSGAGKDTVIVAVLDTGVDTMNVVQGKYLWRNTKEKGSAMDADGNCYNKDIRGWNFVDNSPNINDDNMSLHGTIVSQYIIDEFVHSTKNFVQIMSLKTHDNQGSGDLFSSICALHYALDKGANIINASWGFYYYQEGRHPYLDSLITNVLREKGVLFVTAAGNKIDAVDDYAETIYQAQHGEAIPDSLLRNLEIHNFYPACLSDSTNNVIVATTTNGNRTALTQNYASRYVDFGVIADTLGSDFMKFKIPFTTTPLYISGSSFATAILSGKIGAYTAKSAYKPNLNKQGFISSIESGAGVNTAAPLESKKLIKKGRFIKRQ